MSGPAPQGPAAPGAGWRVRLDRFEGTLQDLLHLIRTETIDVAEVPMADVARQYNAYLEALGSVDLEEAGDHLVGAATLVYLKSRRLLPPDPAAEAALIEEAGAEGLRPVAGAEALRRVAEHLQEREAAMELVYSRPADRVAEYAGEQVIEADLFALLRAFQAILQRVGDDPASRLTRERMTLAERIHWLVETLTRERRIGFRALFAGLADRISCVLTFLALLEVMRLRIVRAYQSHHQEDLDIVLVAAAPSAPAAGEEGRAHA
jgi:segregation and condensation protein A